MSSLPIYPYLGDVSCGIGEGLELLVGDFLDVHVEGVHVHQPLRALAICRDGWAVCSHQELSSRNLHHLYAGNTFYYEQTNGLVNLFEV